MDVLTYCDGTNEGLNEKDMANIENIIRQRLYDSPLAYIVKEWDFYGHSFQVSKDTLIPRQDTELLILIYRNLGLTRYL